MALVIKTDNTSTTTTSTVRSSNMIKALILAIQPYMQGLQPSHPIFD